MRTLVLPCLLLLAGCATARAEAEVKTALEDYAHALARQDAHALAASYAAEGVLLAGDGTRYVGPAQVEAYLASFTGVKVEAARLEPTRTQVAGDRATQEGLGEQRVVLPSGERVAPRVRFRAFWVREDGHWRLEELSTIPR